MPKGQYQRKPKVVEVEMQILAETAPQRTAAYLEAQIANNPDLKAALHAPVHPADMIIGSPVTTDPIADHDAEMQRIASLLSEPTPPMPAVPTRESFDEWLEADAPPMPANDRITQMAGEWAASFCPGEHSVTWLPGPDGQSIVVTLNTAHGTSELVKPAGQWREADIAEALAAMRVELGV